MLYQCGHQDVGTGLLENKAMVEKGKLRDKKYAFKPGCALDKISLIIKKF